MGSVESKGALVGRVPISEDAHTGCFHVAMGVFAIEDSMQCTLLSPAEGDESKQDGNGGGVTEAQSAGCCRMAGHKARDRG